MAKYTKFIQFGKDLNQNIRNPMNAANPLTYCMTPTLNSQFHHGSLSGGILYGNQNSKCMTFMAERCSENWDGFCQAYSDMNTDSYWPNEAVVDAAAYQSAKNFLSLKPTIGQDLLRNSCYRRFIRNPNDTPALEPFDESVANSPVIKRFNNYVFGYSRVKNLSDPRQLDTNPLVQRMLANPSTCLDVLGRIYLAWIRNEDGINIEGTFLEAFFKGNKNLMDQFVRQAIVYVPSFQIQNNEYCCT